MATAEKYLRPNVIAQVGRLDLRAKFIVQGFLSGLHSSPFQGFSVEFSEHRKYTPGDDLKTLDWSVYAKSKRAHRGTILSGLENLKPTGETNTADSLFQLASMIKGKSLVMLFSDLI